MDISLWPWLSKLLLGSQFAAGLQPRRPDDHSVRCALTGPGKPALVTAVIKTEARGRCHGWIRRSIRQHLGHRSAFLLLARMENGSQQNNQALLDNDCDVFWKEGR